MYLLVFRTPFSLMPRGVSRTILGIRRRVMINALWTLRRQGVFTAAGKSIAVRCMLDYVNDYQGQRRVYVCQN
ncbi:hypothetical protein EGX47_15055 [Yersinia pseudotuberculosis]|uniref:Transposase n=3 Tax=Yersinia pseudotuberculosis complex TaxID=1649845 RepID=A0ABM7AJ79_YERPU|nr:hypothetical protein EGX47_15055 [Yersinia pseudotuberculosis]AYW96709.1 hypothetical protein EGX39_13390 [Yersinia pseudotuberculosis]KGA57797.1 hypothetical protein DJ55_1753 [Yersinia pseudotuberculosis]